MEVHIDPSDLLQKMSAFARFIKPAVGLRLDALAEQSVERLKGGVYYKKRSGKANESTRWVHVDTWKRRVKVDVPYAKFLDEGTRPHVIEAHGKALRFVGNGAVMFRKRVNHPGTKPTGFADHERALLDYYLPARLLAAADEAIGLAKLG